MYAQKEKPKENTTPTGRQESMAVANSVLQKKSNVQQGVGFVDNRPEAVVQRKIKSLVNNLATTKPIQKVGWQIVDSRETKEAMGLVEGNVSRASAETRVLDKQTIYKDEDPDKGIADKDKELPSGEVLHIHAHGLEGGVAGMRPATFVTALTSKFKVSTIKGHTIIFHTCEVGAGSFLRDVLDGLMKKSSGHWNGTTLLAPMRVMLVNKQGVSIVANEGHNRDSELNIENRRKIGVLGKKGDGWAGAKVNGNNIETLTPPVAKRTMRANT